MARIFCIFEHPIAVLCSMKTCFRLLLLLFALFTIETASAQNFRLGLKMGGNGSWLRGDMNSDNILKEFKVGLHYGAYGTFHFMKIFALQPEILYSAKGNNFFDGIKGLKLDMQYVDVPLLFQIWPSDKFAIYFGPQAGLIYSANLEDKDSGDKTCFTDKIKFTDFGFIAGACVELKGGIRFFARYNHGLVDVSDDEVRVMHNSVIQTGIGFSFIKTKE